jgi:ABC-type Fe3+ transport system substrate-binding protein
MSPLPWAKRGELVAIKDSLMLPGVTNPSVWFGGKLSYADATEKFMPIPAEYAGGRPLINADLVAANAITTWDDLLKPQFKGKIAAIDPTDGGIGTTAAEYIAKAKGVEFIARLFKEQNVTLVTDRRQLVEAVTRGVYAIALGADAAPEIETFRQAGVTSLKVLALKDGPGNLNGGCSVTSVPVKAPHPNAALVFANWFLSVRGQEAYALGQHQPSNRSDVSKAGVQVNLIPEPGVDYFSTYRENFFVNERTALDAAIAKAIGK